MIKDVLEISSKERKLSCLVCFGTFQERTSWVNEHFEILDRVGYTYSTPRHELTDVKDNRFMLWVYKEEGSFNELMGQEFHRVMGLQNVSYEARKFIQTRLKVHNVER